MALKDLSIRELIEKIDRDDIRLPEIQRDYVWSKKKVCDLLDSIYRKYPSGTILTWETDNKIDTRDFAVEKKNVSEEEKRKKEDFELLLDGQQRLTSLCSVIKGSKVEVKGTKEFKSIQIIFNLDHPDIPPDIMEDEEDEEDKEEDDDEDNEDNKENKIEKMTFAVANKNLLKLHNWVSMEGIFDGKTLIPNILKEKGIDKDHEKYDEYYSKLSELKNIEKYLYRVVTLEREKTYQEVAGIFVRVNSKGTILKSADLALAQITAKWKGSSKIFGKFSEECFNNNFSLDLSIHLKNLVSFASGQSRFKVVSGLSKSKLEKAWQESKEGMNNAINFLGDIGIDSSVLLASPFVILPICYYWHQTEGKIEREMLKRWILLANMKGRYSLGSTESYLDRDLETIDKGGDFIVKNLIDDLETHFGRLSVNPSDLENVRFRKTMFIMFKMMGAKDWRKESNLRLNKQGNKHQIEYHHIFPKKFLKRNNITDKKKIDDIGNIACIESSTNKEINDKDPMDYKEDFEGYKKLFAQQCIPCDKGKEKDYYLKVENYEEFLEKRRSLIADCLNKFILGE